jgi:hypothetical protein
MQHQASSRSIRSNALPILRSKQVQAAAPVAWAVAQFGDATSLDTQREMGPHRLRPGHHALRPGQQLGPPFGSSEVNFGRILHEDLKAYRDELIVSAKVARQMWPVLTVRAVVHENTCSPP